MIPTPPHNRKLGLNGVALTKQRNNRLDINALAIVRNAVEKVIIEANYLEGAPFSWVTIAVRYGLKNDEKPTYHKINEKYGDLPLAIEVDTHELIDASLDELKFFFGKAVLKSLIDAGERFERPVDPLKKMLSNLPGSLDGS